MRFLKTILVLLMLAAPAQAGLTGVAGVIPSITVGGRVFTDLLNLKILACNATGATTVRCTLAISTTPAAGYAVTAAKTLRIRAIKLRDDTPGSPSTVTFYQSDNDVGQTGASTALTNGVQKSFAFPLLDLTAQGIDTGQEWPTNFTVAAAKYLTAQLSGVVKTAYFMAFGYEE